MAENHRRIGPHSRALRPGNVDGRTRLGKLLRATRRDIVAALGGDLTPMQALLVDRVAEKHARCLMLAHAMLTATDTATAFESERSMRRYLTGDSPMARAERSGFQQSAAGVASIIERSVDLHYRLPGADAAPPKG